MRWVAAFVLGLVAAVCVTSLRADMIGTSEIESTRYSRSCVYPIGGWAIIDCSNSAAAQSAQLTAKTRYVVQCGDDSYLATGDQSTDEADSSDGWLPAGAWLEFQTTDTVRYLSCKNKNADSDCRILECQ